MKLESLCGYLDKLLMPDKYTADSSSNGLQIEGAKEVRKAVFGVDASLALFRAAADARADFIFAHHGISWRAEPRRFTDITAGRLAFMFRHGISLYGCHLPLDGHAEVGNNAGLLRLAGVTGELENGCCFDGMVVGMLGELPEAITVSELAGRLASGLHSAAAPAVMGEPGRKVSRLAAVSGGGGNSAVAHSFKAGADALITGELTHEMFHPVREFQLPVVALGHYLSETVGPRAVMQKVQSELGLDCEFIDLPTGL